MVEVGIWCGFVLNINPVCVQIIYSNIQTDKQNNLIMTAVFLFSVELFDGVTYS